MELLNLKTNYLGRNVSIFESIDSTQLEIIRRIQSDKIKNGDMIVADIQTKGVRNTWQKMVYR